MSDLFCLITLYISFDISFQFPLSSLFEKFHIPKMITHFSRTKWAFYLLLPVQFKIYYIKLFTELFLAYIVLKEMPNEHFIFSICLVENASWICKYEFF